MHLNFFRTGNKDNSGPVDLVLSCVDNFGARMTINTVSIIKLKTIITKYFDFFSRHVMNLIKHGWNQV
jgi:hypothetical protein